VYIYEGAVLLKYLICNSTAVKLLIVIRNILDNLGTGSRGDRGQGTGGWVRGQVGASAQPISIRAAARPGSGDASST
jgi:hypothetical protein